LDRLSSSIKSIQKLDYAYDYHVVPKENAKRDETSLKTALDNLHSSIETIQKLDYAYDYHVVPNGNAKRSENSSQRRCRDKHGENGSGRDCISLESVKRKDNSVEAALNEITSSIEKVQAADYKHRGSKRDQASSQRRCRDRRDGNGVDCDCISPEPVKRNEKDVEAGLNEILSSIEKVQAADYKHRGRKRDENSMKVALNEIASSVEAIQVIDYPWGR
jgi:hypothetical protein